MKTLFVHYSLDGSCRELAELMAADTGAAVAELRLVGGNFPHNFFRRLYRGGKASLLKETPELLPLSADVAGCGLVVVGTPVWFWNMTPAVRSFLNSTDFTGKKVALFAVYGGMAGVTLSAMKRLVERRGGVVTAQAGFTDLHKRGADATRRRALEWARGLAYRA